MWNWLASCKLLICEHCSLKYANTDTLIEIETPWYCTDRFKCSVLISFLISVLWFLKDPLRPMLYNMTTDYFAVVELRNFGKRHLYCIVLSRLLAVCVCLCVHVCRCVCVRLVVCFMLLLVVCCRLANKDI